MNYIVDCKHCGAKVRISDLGKVRTPGRYVCGKCKTPVTAVYRGLHEGLPKPSVVYVESSSAENQKPAQSPSKIRRAIEFLLGLFRENPKHSTYQTNRYSAPNPRVRTSRHTAPDPRVRNQPPGSQNVRPFSARNRSQRQSANTGDRERWKDIQNSLAIGLALNNILNITYKNRKGITSERLIEIHHLGPRYFDAFDHKERKFRTFRIGRVIKIERTSGTYSRRPNYVQSPYMSPPYPRPPASED